MVLRRFRKIWVENDFPYPHCSADFIQVLQRLLMLLGELEISGESLRWKDGEYPSKHNRQRQQK